MLKVIFVVVACLQAVSAFTCPEDNDTFYHADVSTGCQVYHLCQNSQLQTLTCPSGEAFNHVTLLCEDASTVNCIETMGDHSHHHHHHKRSAEGKVDLEELNPETDQMIKPPKNSPQKERRIIDGIAAFVVFGSVPRHFETILIYCKHYGSCSSSLLPDVPILQREDINRERNLAIFERDNPHMNISELKKEVDYNVRYKLFYRHIFAQYFNITEDAFLFDDMPLVDNDSHQRHKRSVEEELDTGDSKHVKSTEDNQEKRGKNFENEDNSFFYLFCDIILAYCKHYDSCSSSFHANVSRSEKELINRERSVAKFERNNPTTDIFDIKNFLDDGKPFRDLFREAFAAVFNINEDEFLSYFFDDKHLIKKDSPKHASPLAALFRKNSMTPAVIKPLHLFTSSLDRI